MMHILEKWTLASIGIMLIVTARPPFILAQEPKNPALSEEEQKQRQLEFNQTFKEYRKAVTLERFEEAAATAEKGLQLARSIYGHESPAATHWLKNGIDIYLRLENFPSARAASEQILRIEEKRLGKNHWQVVDARLALAHVEQLAKLTKEQRQDLAKIPMMLKRSQEIWIDRPADSLKLKEQVCDLRKKVLGDKHPAYADSLDDLAFSLFGTGDFAKLGACYRDALAIRKATVGEKHPKYAEALARMASVWQGQGDFDKAEPLLKQAIDLNRTLFDPKDMRYQNGMQDLVQNYIGQKQFGKVEALFKELLEINKSGFGEKSDQYAVQLKNMALYFRDRGDMVKAIALEKQAEAIIKSANMPPMQSTAQIELTKATNDYHKALAEGKLDEAIKAATKSIQLRQELYGPDGGTLVMRKDLCRLLLTAENFQAARALQVEILPFVEKKFGKDHWEVVDVRLALANIDLMVKLTKEQRLEVVKARQLQQQAASLTGKPQEVLKLLQQSAAIFKNVLGDKHPDHAECLGRLADHCWNISLEDVEHYAQQTLAIIKEVKGANHPDTLNYTNRLANVLSVQKQDVKVEPLRLEVLRISKVIYGEKHHFYAFALDGLAVFYRNKGEYAKAEKLYLEALELSRDWRTFKPDARSLHNLATLYDCQGDLAKAISFSSQALKAETDHMYESLAGGSSEESMLRSGNTANCLSSYLSTSSRAGTPAEQVYANILPIKGVLTIRQQRLREFRLMAKSRDPEVAPLLTKLDEVTQQIAAIALSPVDPKQNTGTAKRYNDLIAERTRVEQLLEEKTEASRSGVIRWDHVTPGDLQKSLPVDGALIDCLIYTPRNKDGAVVTGPHLVAFVLTSKQVHRVELGPLAPISQKVDDFLQRIAIRVVPILGKDDPAIFLRDTVWTPLAKHLAGVKTVLISPDGPLCRLPWAALPTEKGDQFLIEERLIAMLPVPRLLPRIVAAPVPETNPNLLLIGNIDFDDAEKATSSVVATPFRGAPSTKFGSLPGTAREINLIAEHFREHSATGKSLTLSQKQATEANIRKHIGDYEYVHFATHGFFAPEKYQSFQAPSQDKADLLGRGMGLHNTGFHPGVLSGIVLAGANNPSANADNVLTALEVGELNLDRVQLAVLSACETGLGQTAGGEGVLGLQRAFQIAGARSTITSYWKVADDATQKMMVRFYENRWRKKMSTLEALRETQLWMLQEGAKIGFVRGLERDDQPRLEIPKGLEKARTPAYFWAAFTLSGDWR